MSELKSFDSNPFLFRVAGWASILSAVSTILGFFSLMLFFVLGDPFGKINDIASILIALSSFPVFYTLHMLHRAVSFPLSLGAMIVGVVAMAVAGVVQSLFVLGLIPYENTVFVSPLAFAIFGISVSIFSLLARKIDSLHKRLTFIGIAAGAGYFLVGLGFVLGGQNHPLSYIGGLAAVVAFPVWAIGLGRTILKLAGKNQHQ